MMSSTHTPMRTRSPTPPKYLVGASKFFLVLTAALTLVLLSVLRDSWSPLQNVLSARSLQSPVESSDTDDRCYMVHEAVDQCAWVRADCPTDEGGFTAVLELYYCTYAHFKYLVLPGLCVWLALLFTSIGITASEFFCPNLNTIARLLGMSETLTGVTFLALGNGSPDVFSTFAAMSTNSGSLAIGELYGAAGFIVSVVPGIMACIRPFHVSKKTFIRDVGFFTGAAAFSMVFLKDGKLHLWEAIAMIIYYLFYVAFVAIWHWYVDRRKRLRNKEVLVRGHFLPPGDEGEVHDVTYRDDPNQTTDTYRHDITRGVSWEDWSALEGQGGDRFNQDEDAEEQARDRWMGELASNMRVARPNARSRKNTIATPVRPSLVGALEFQNVLRSLQKSRNFQTIPLDSRRYSDDPTFTTLQQQDQLSTTSDPAARPLYQVHITDENSPLLDRTDRNLLTPQTAPVGRTRAVSVNDVAAPHLNSGFSQLSPIPSEDNLLEVSSNDTGSQRSRERSRSHLDVPSQSSATNHTSPSLRIEPATPQRDSPLGETRPMISSRAPGDLLAPPTLAAPNRPASDYFGPSSPSRQSIDSPRDSPRAVPRAHRLPQIVIPPRNRSRSSSRTTSPFPAYRDYPSPSVTGSTRSPISTRPPSLYLPPAMGSPESLPADQAIEQEVPRRPPKFAKIWPYSILPPPGVIGSTLFPAFYDWQDKSWYSKILGVASAPSVFFLMLTLPVVDYEKDTQNNSPMITPKSLSWDSTQSKSAVSTITPKGLDCEYSDVPDAHYPNSASEGPNNMESTATVAVHAEEHHRHSRNGNISRNASFSGEPHLHNADLIGDKDEQQPELWNRWLTIIQLFLAPIVVVIAIWLQDPSAPPSSWLIKPTLICLPISTVLLIPFLLTTTPTYRPRIYRIILSLAGFVVAVAWISAIASQVVGALKALAVILNISHALMGLTVFAVGNSLGDLVANFTVARLGYPLMGLSACFGGPMLNILLGIGIAGTYNLIQGAEKRQLRHPGKGLKFKPVHIEVSQTLILSGFILLITLVFVLIAVPLNKWVFDRRIGFALMILWVISTVFNVCADIYGIPIKF